MAHQVVSERFARPRSLAGFAPCRDHAFRHGHGARPRLSGEMHPCGSTLDPNTLDGVLMRHAHRVDMALTECTRESPDAKVPLGEERVPRDGECAGRDLNPRYWLGKPM